MIWASTAASASSRFDANAGAAGVDLASPALLFGATVVLSNVVSNVPAVMLLLPVATHPIAGATLALASTLLVAVAALAAPVTFVTGWSDASTRFGSSAGGVFGQKKTLGITLVIVCLGVTAWRVIAGIGQAPSGAAEITAYSAALLVANGLAVRLGMLGGKLVFGH